MIYDPDRHHRRSIRLRGYDYALGGAYFVTICTQDGACLLGEVVDGVARLSDAGNMVQSVWDALPDRYSGVATDAFVIMPNHMHGIILLTGGNATGHTHLGASTDRDASLSLPDVVHRLKSLTTRRYIEGVRQHGWPAFRGRLWQRNYYEHIIRDDDELPHIREYITMNPAQWTSDRENPESAW